MSKFRNKFSFSVLMVVAFLLGVLGVAFLLDQFGWGNEVKTFSTIITIWAGFSVYVIQKKREVCISSYARMKACLEVFKAFANPIGRHQERIESFNTHFRDSLWKDFLVAGYTMEIVDPKNEKYTSIFGDFKELIKEWRIAAGESAQATDPECKKLQGSDNQTINANISYGVDKPFKVKLEKLETDIDNMSQYVHLSLIQAIITELGLKPVIKPIKDKPTKSV